VNSWCHLASQGACLPQPPLFYESQVTTHKSLSLLFATHPKNAPASPFLATLPKTPDSKSFACHRSKSPRGSSRPSKTVSSVFLRYPFPSSFSLRSPLGTRLPCLPRAPRRAPLARGHSPLATIFFRMNTYKSVSKQMTSTPFRMNTFSKTRGGGGSRSQRPASTSLDVLAKLALQGYTRIDEPASQIPAVRRKATRATQRRSRPHQGRALRPLRSRAIERPSHWLGHRNWVASGRTGCHSSGTLVFRRFSCPRQYSRNDPLAASSPEILGRLNGNKGLATYDLNPKTEN
jgi:hypothetical protein